MVATKTLKMRHTCVGRDLFWFYSSKTKNESLPLGRFKNFGFYSDVWDNFLQSIRTRDSVSFVSRVSASLWTFTSSIKCVQALREIFPFVYFPDLNLNLYRNRVNPPPKCLVFPTANEEEQTGSSIGKYVPLTSPSGFHPYSYSCIFLHC